MPHDKETDSEISQAQLEQGAIWENVTTLGSPEHIKVCLTTTVYSTFCLLQLEISLSLSK